MQKKPTIEPNIKEMEVLQDLFNKKKFERQLKPLMEAIQ
jgi:hypothetical protein